MPVGLRPPGGPGGQNPEKTKKSGKIHWKWSQARKPSNNIHIVRVIACLTPFPAEFITIIPVGLWPPGGPGGQNPEKKIRKILLEMESGTETL